MKRIFKYSVSLEPAFAVAMPVGAEVLTVQVQGLAICFWALIDDDVPNRTRQFRMFGTGEPIEEEPGRYIGTIQLNGGSLIFHYFEAKE